MLAYIYRSAQGAVFALVLAIAGATRIEAALAFMIGISFDPRNFWWFL